MKKALSLVLALMMLMTMCIVPVMAADPDGSAENPYYVANPMTAPNFITIPANSTVYYQYNAMVFNGWSVEGYGLSAILVDGFAYDQPDMWGSVSADFNFSMMSPGIVGYVNGTDEEIQVMLTHNEPKGTLENPADLQDGDNAIFIPATIMEYVAIYLPMVNGDYTFSTEQTEEFQITVFADASPAEGGTPIYVENGSLTLTLESYMPVYVVVTPVGMTGDVVLNVAPPKAGTADNPHWLEADVLYDMEGTEPVYFQVDGSLAGNTLLIESFNGTDLTVSLDGVNHIAENGALYLPLKTNSWVMELVISQAEESNNTVYFSIIYAEGSMENPIALEKGDNTISIPDGVVGYYYSYVVEADGLLIVTPASVDGIGYLSMADVDYTDFAYLQEGASSMMMPVTAGEVITIECNVAMDEETFEYVALDTVLNIAIKDLVLYSDFEDGDADGWSSDSPITADDVDYISGWYSGKFEATKNWVSMYRYLNVEANTDYVISFKMKALLDKGLWVKFNNNWGPDLDSETVTPTTEWADYEVTLNSGEATSVILMLQYTDMGEDGQVFWFDDIVVTKAEGGDTPVEPPVEGENLIVNGGFETGELAPWDNLWNWTSPSIVEDAHTGKYALKYSAAGAWQHVRQIVGVEANTDYVLTLWAKDANALTFLVKDGADTTNIKEGYSEAGSEWKQYTVEFNSGDNTSIIFTLMSNGANATAIIDDIVLAKASDVAPEVSFDGYIYNGDFETGNLTNWINLWDGCGYEFVEGYESNNAISITAGNWSQIRQNGIAVVPNTDYVLTAWVKNANNFGLIVKKGDDSGDIASVQPDNGTDWTQVTLKFNSGDETEICVLLIGWEGGGSAIIDNVSIAVDETPVEPPVEITYGDADGNGKINNRDLALLQQMINGWEVEIDESAADVDGNGKINNRDLALLQQFINGWDVTLGG